jgi:high-affinity iron transporter
LGILTKLKQWQSVKIVYFAAFLALVCSVALLLGTSVAGIKIHDVYRGKTEELFEGVMMITSALFITWAVFSLHRYFARQKVRLLSHVRETIATGSQRGIFVLVFLAVFREGFEIVLFLSTVYLSETPRAVLGGFSAGLLCAGFISLLLFTSTLKLPVFRAFQITTLFLILFAGGLLLRGIHEFVEFGLLPELTSISISWLPGEGHVVSELTKSLLGWSRQMDYLGLMVYAGYITFMRWYVYQRTAKPVS